MTWRTLLLPSLAAGLTILALGCSKTSSSGDAKTASSGQVILRAEGFEASPAWAQKDAPWSQEDGHLSLVGHVEVAGNQRLEMAYRAADSYARAELLRFLQTRVIAVLQESTSSQDGESVKEQIEERAQALVDDWLIATRYWEKRKVGGQERLDVYSRMDVDLESVTALFDKAALSDDLRLRASKRLQEVWPELQKAAVQSAPDAHAERGIMPPEWARAGDQEEADEFSMVCQGSATEEKEALALAKARCDEKLCRLLGVKIQARTSVTETLDEMTAESQVSETCDARIVGRTVKNKGGECGPGGCVFWLRQTYPRSEYKKELERLAAPQVIRQEVVIQEGDQHYKDPAACETALRSYAAVSVGSATDSDPYSEKGLKAADYQSRLRYLRQALGFCQGIDGRDSGLFQALNTILLTPLPTFINEGGSWSGPQNARSAFVFVPAGFKRELETKRFLTDRIQAIAKVCEDAILPMRIFDIPKPPKGRGPNADEVRASASVLDELAAVPFSDTPVAPSHRTTLHRIVFDPMFGTRPPISTKYRKLLLTELAKGHLPCDASYNISASGVIGYLGAGGELDAEEWSAGVSYLKKAEDAWLNRCIYGLLPDKTPAATQRTRAKELTGLVILGKVARTRKIKDVTTRPALDTELLSDIFRSVPPEDQLALYLEIRTNLPKDKESERLASKVAEANFSNQYSNKSARQEDLALCEGLPTRLPPLLSQAPELRIEDTLTCGCMELKTLSPASRAAIRKLWLSTTNKECRHFLPAEHPDGEYRWSPPQRRWSDGPFVRMDSVLEREDDQCDSASVISGLDFSPTVRATLIAGRLSKVTVSAAPDGTLSNLDWGWNKAPPGRSSEDWVRKSDIPVAVKAYEECLRAAAEGYQVDPSDLQTKETGPQRIWLEMGDQGSSNGFGE